MKSSLLILMLIVSLYASAEDNVSKGEILRDVPRYVVDAKAYGLIESKHAYFVIGAEVYGTMKENFAFAKKEDAEAYAKGKGGKVVDYETYIRTDLDNLK